jgi:hypothetical protein
MVAESIKEQQISKPKQKTKEIIKLAKNNVPVTTIAQATGTSKANVSQTLKRYNIKVALLNNFKDNRSDILAGIQERALKSLTDADIKKASIKDRVILFGTMYDKERIELGLGDNSKQPLVVILRDRETVKVVSDKDIVDV